MNTQLFRIVVWVNLGLVLLAGIANVTAVPDLPLPLRSYAEAQRAWEPGSLLPEVFLYFIALLGIASYFGLLKLKRWGPPCFTAAWTVSVVPLWGPVIQPTWEAIFAELSLLSAGAIIALAYWSPVSAAFRHTSPPPNRTVETDARDGGARGSP